MSELHLRIQQTNKCKKYNKQLWKCIEDNEYMVSTCGKYYYNFFKCFQSLK